MNMTSILSSVSLSLLLSTLSIPVMAQDTATPNINKRQIQQQKRIGEGVRSGELTAKEAANLEMREAKIQADKREAKSDGVVTDAERARLQAQENRVSRKIYRKKHNERAVQ